VGKRASIDPAVSMKVISSVEYGVGSQPSAR
jgi:hypothetical protein